uniref:Mitochondrial ribosomal protein S9 n=1 Tax=Oncorhynchus kisutch TaxID=8019 RepID=A0A8C7GP81_ONCKI
MAASCGKTVGYFLWKFGNCCFNFNTNLLSPTPQVLSRQLCVSAVLHRKNLAAAGPEKFSEEFGKRHLTAVMSNEGCTTPAIGVNQYIYIYIAVQWGADRRPFHFLFYTGKQSYYSLMHDTFTKALAVEKHQDRLRGKDLFTQDGLLLFFHVVCVSRQYARFIQLMERLLSLPNCSVEEDFQVQPLQYDQHGVAYSTGDGRRKTATGTVLLRDTGSGSISINGTNYVHYFPVLQDRIFMLHLTAGHSHGGGHSSQAGALRLAISRAMLSFLSEGQVETMRQAGLLTPGPRIKERKKPGQEGARRKFTWKKR